ncbi:MAG: FtsQ-type POTRA domain-containing protein [Mogibacterium sp.]|nr:FtsQ-type POTRA domain-containing protein [Mogibacterium sp.]
MPDFDTVLDNMERRKAKRENRKGPKYTVRALIVLLVLGVLYAFSFTSIFTVTSIEVYGNSFYTDEQVANIAHAETGVNIFHKANTARMKKYLEDDPYITEAKVSKSFPDKIVITIKERRQVGAVVYGDEYLIIDIEGYLIRRTRTQPKITIIRGLRVNSIVEGERLGTTDPEMFQDALDIIAAMEAGDVYFMELEMSELTVRAHIYDALICVGSADQIVYAIEQKHLQQILETLFSRGIKRGTINITDEGFASFSPVV